MKKSKVLPYKVLTTVGLAALLISSTAFAESPAGFSANDNSIDHSSIRERAEFFKSGFSNEENQNTDNDQNGLSNLYGENSNKIENQFKPNDKVRIIVEVDSSVDSSTSENTKENKFKENQDGVIDKIKKTKDLDLKVKHRFFKGLNGFSTETEYKNLKDIQSTKGVVNVHIAREFQPSMAASKELVQAQKVWESYGYQGEGLVVGVVDSGIDWLHKDMTITDKGKQQEKWTKEKIQGKFDDTDVNEIWYSDKVPTGYDWADNDTDVVPHGLYGSPHGTHVAGTVGANGDEATDGVKGIAPGVQLLAEKVFSDNGGGAYEDDIIAGIQHAVTMGADVINMSLGVDSGYVGEDYDPIQKAIREATEEGTLVVVAGGNSSYSTNNIKLSRSLKPYADNPDIGTVGAPGVSPFALSVASYENSKIHMNALKSTTGDLLPYKDQAGKKLSDVLTSGKNYDLVYVGAGRAADYANKNVEGKIVVMKPDSETGYSANVVFQNEAQKRKAVAILQVPGAKMPDYPAMDFSPYYLTAMTTSKQVGNDLIAKLTSGQNVSMQMSSFGTYVDNATKDNMSFFSSYGTPSTLEFKPEISAPGGSIYSTLPGNKYGVFSGTSMATPHVAGGSALVLQSLYQKGNAHSEDTALKTKLALMNTSKVIMDPATDYTIPYSPRRQGSGLMQIANAIKTPAILRRTNVPLEEAGAVALKEIKNKNLVTFNLSLDSLEANKTSNKNDLEYSVYVDLLTDGTENKSFDYNKDGVADESHDYLTLKSKRVEGAKIVVNNQTVTASNGAVVSVKPGQKREIEVQISLPSDMKDKQFLEGFVRLVPTGENKDQAVPLTVPYMGFFGDWTELNNLDPVAWSDKAFLGYTALWDDMSDYPMGYNTKTGKFGEATISPNTIAPGVFSSFTALRNLKETEMYVEDAQGNKVKYLGNWSEYTPDGTPYKFRKNMMFNGDFFYRFDEFDAPNYTWNERNEKDEIVPDGTYYYVIKTTMDYPTAKPQYVKLPVKVDSTLVKISDIQYKPTTNGKYEVTWDAVDSENGSGYNNAIVYVNGQYFEAKNGSKSIIVPNEPKGIVVEAYDKAGNISYSLWGDPSYIKESMMLLTFSVSGTNVNETTPARIISFANNRVNWKLIMKDANGNLIDTFDVENEHSLRVSFLPDSDIPDGTYYVSAEVTSLDGFKVTTKPKSFTVKH